MKTALLAYGATALVLAATSGWAVETKSKPAAKPTVYPIVRFISAGAPDRDGRLDQLTPMDLADLYTSLKITPSKSMAGPRIVDDSLICEPDNKTTPGKADCEPERAYSKERPSWLFRLFGTRTINIAAVANVQISDPDLPISAPLFSIQHQTLHNAPDEFVSNYTSSHSATPLFRIGASSVFTLHVHEAISNNQTFTGVSSLIQAVETATTIAAPHATLLTTLSSQDVSNASQAIDTAISGILSFQQTEDIELAHVISLTFADLSGRPTVYTIAARVPSNDVKFSYELTAGKSESVATDYDNKAEPAPTIGYWYVWLTCPRPSIFSAEDICNSLPATAEPDGSSPAYGKASNAVGSAGTSDDASPGLNSPTPGKPATPTGSGGTVGNGSEDALRVLPLSTPANSGAPRASAGNSVGASAQAPQPPARTENTPTPSSAVSVPFGPPAADLI